MRLVDQAVLRLARPAQRPVRDLARGTGAPLRGRSAPSRRRARCRCRARASGRHRPQPEPAVLLVRRRDHGQRVAARAIGERRADRVGERRREQRSIAASPSAERRSAPARMVGADRAAGAGREADELGVRAALDAARQVRQVAGEPQQLQLEREPERVERRPAAGDRRRVVEQVEEPRQRVERALVRLGLAEEPQHRLGADQPDVQAVAVLAGRVVRAEQLDAGDRLQLAAALVQHQLDVRQRLEPRAEPRLRLAHAFRDRADPAAVAV